MEKKYNIVLGLMIFFFIIVVGVALAWGLGYIGINKNNSAIVNNNSSSKNLASNNEIKIETVEKNQENGQPVKEIVKEVTIPKMLEYDYTKCKNPSEGGSYEGAIANIYNDGEREYVVLVYPNGDAKINVGDLGVDYPVNNLKGKVKDSMIGSYSPTGDMIVYLLLEDGTVQSICDFSMFKQVGFTADEVIEGVSNIVRLETIINAGNKRIPVAIDRDGNFYVLR